MDPDLTALRGCDVEAFSLKGMSLLAKVVDVYDGDTFRAIFVVPGLGVTKMCCRMLGINAPELKLPRSMSPGTRHTTLSQAVRARNRLCDLLTNCTTSLPSERRVKLQTIIDDENTKLVTLHCGGFDKYGRLLVDVYDGDLCINAVMMEEHLAVPFMTSHQSASSDL